LAEGNVDDARACLSRFIASVPLDARAYYALAELSLLNGDPVRADSASANAVALKPDYIEALVLRGRILGMKGNAGEAQKLLETACRLAPESAEAHFQLGVLFDSKNDPGEAVAQFRKVLLLNAKNPRANDYLALNLERLGKAEEAAAAYKAGLLVNSGPLFDSFLDYNYARFLMKRNCLAESKSHLDRAVSLAPETRAVYYERARVNLRLNRYEEARADAEHARSLPDPEGFVLDLQVYYLLSTIYGRLGQTDLARKYAELSRTTRVPLRWAGRM
jgi:tetratricopeptide (TPR) repeat protein